jgi:hypothetical protein
MVILEWPKKPTALFQFKSEIPRRPTGKTSGYLKDSFTRLPAAKITEIQQFTPRAWAKGKASKNLVEQAA